MKTRESIKKTAEWSQRESQYNSGHLQICYNIKTGLVWPVWHTSKYPLPEYDTDDILFCGFLEKPTTAGEIASMILETIMNLIP